MKLKSLVLGSVAFAGLSTGAYAADLNTLTSLDVCDMLGISGLTLSSDTNCLKITGGVSYEFDWGNYDANDTNYNTDNRKLAGGIGNVTDYTLTNDWSTSTNAWLTFVGTADSDFGPASAHITLNASYSTTYSNSVLATGSSISISEAYVSIGDSTVLMAGLKGGIGNFGDDTPLNYLSTFLSTDNDAGVDYDWNTLATGGQVIQIVSDLGNGFSVGAGLENLDGTPSSEAGTLVGVMSYAGDNVTGHVTFLAGGILDSAIEDWAVHAGITATMDNFEVRAAGVYDDDAFGVSGFFEGMLSAKATFDMFTLAATVDGDNAGTTAGSNQVGFGVSGSAAVTDGVKVNLGFRWHDNDTSTSDSEVWQAEAQIVADVTDTITLTGALGVYGETVTDSSTVYGKGEVAWNPGGGFETSFGGTYWSNGAYKTVFKASKSFE